MGIHQTSKRAMTRTQVPDLQTRVLSTSPCPSPLPVSWESWEVGVDRVQCCKSIDFGSERPDTAIVGM